MARKIFLISDGTCITVEAVASSLMNQFDVEPTYFKYPFIDSVDKAHHAISDINRVATKESYPPVVLYTVVNPDIIDVIKNNCNCLALNVLGSMLTSLEREFNIEATHKMGRFDSVSKSKSYQDRMEAINYTLAHDDGQTGYDIEAADVIILGVSRSGKTPTSLYLAMQHGIKTANYPIIPEDFEKMQLPKVLVKQKNKLFGLSIDPKRLSEIRNERFKGSHYASLENCIYEVNKSEQMMNNFGIQWISSTNRSIEEISTIILQNLKKL